MKKSFIISVFAVALFSFSAQAAPAAKVLATVETSGGMPGPNSTCLESHLDVLDTGEVVQTKCGKNPHTLLTLSAQVVGDIVADETPLNDLGSLQALDPSQPQCADAPSTIYSALTDAGKFTDVGGKINCCDVGPKVTTYEAYELRQLLESLAVIARF